MVRAYEPATRRAPWKTKGAAEFATLGWVSWFKHHRLPGPIGTSRLQKLRQTTTGNSPSGRCGSGLTEDKRPPQKPGRFKQIEASGK